MPTFEQQPENKPFEGEQKFPSEEEIKAFFESLEEFEEEKWDEKAHRDLSILGHSVMNLFDSERIGSDEGLRIATEDTVRYYLYSPPDIKKGFKNSFSLVRKALTENRSSDLSRVKINAYLSNMDKTGETMVRSELFTKVLTPPDKNDLFALYSVINNYMASEPVNPEEAARRLIEEAKTSYNIGYNDIKRYAQLDDRIRFYFEPKAGEVTGSVTRDHRFRVKEVGEIEESRQRIKKSPGSLPEPTPDVIENLHRRIQYEYSDPDIQERSGQEKQKP